MYVAAFGNDSNFFAQMWYRLQYSFLDEFDVPYKNFRYFEISASETILTIWFYFWINSGSTESAIFPYQLHIKH